MQTMRTTLLIIVCLTLLGACGLKGPLYLPEEKPAAEQTAPEKNAEQEKDTDQKKEDTGQQAATGP